MIHIKAKDIHDCNDCPLYKEECSGGWTSGSGGEPIEPPCYSWNPEDETHNYEYEPEDYPTEDDVKRLQELERIHNKEREDNRKREIERLTKLVHSKTKYGITKMKYYGSIVWAYFCPNCNKWVYPTSEHSHHGICEATCPECGDTLVYCDILNQEYKNNNQ